MSKVTVAEKLSAIGNNMARVYDTGFEEGKKAERDAFWDAFQTPSRVVWTSAFQNSCWNDDTFYPKYDLIATDHAASLFRYCGITDLEKRLEECGVILDTSEATNLNCGFGEARALTVIPTINLTKCTDSGATSGLFAGCISLKTIRKIIVNETIMFPNSFMNCPMLENIAFEGVIGSDIDFKSSTKLTEASIRGIITHLSDTASGKTLTLSKVAVDNAFVFGFYDPNNPENNMEIPGTAEDNPFWPQLRDSKPNWTITLV